MGKIRSFKKANEFLSHLHESKMQVTDLLNAFGKFKEGWICINGKWNLLVLKDGKYSFKFSKWLIKN